MAYKIVVLKVDDVLRGGMTEAVTEGAEMIDSALNEGYTVAFKAVGEKYTLVYLHQMPDTDMLGNPLDAAGMAIP